MRIASFCRHLPSWGWEPSVVTIGWNKENSDWIDDSLPDGALEERVVYRSPEPDLRRSSSKVPPLFRWDGIRKDWMAAARNVIDRGRHGERVDGSWHFIRGATRFLEQHLAAERYDLVLATSPDLAPLRIAHSVAPRHGIPWVADCRDDYVMLKPGRPVYGDLELEYLSSASAIVTVSSGVRETLESRTGRSVQVVENGYDEALLETKSRATVDLDPSCLNIVYTGSLANYYPERSPGLLLGALEEVLKDDPSARIKVHFFGDKNLGPVLADLTGRFPSLQPVLVDHGRVTFQESIAAQRSAGLLLLLTHPGLKGILTGKLFEYLVAGRPVLGVPGDDDEVDALLGRAGVGRTVSTHEEAVNYLKSAYQAWVAEGAIPCDPRTAEIEKYSRRVLTGRLASILDATTAESREEAL